MRKMLLSVLVIVSILMILKIVDGNKYKDKFDIDIKQSELAMNIEKKYIIKEMPILYYHSVTNEIFGIEELHMSPEVFDIQMKYLKDNDYDVIGFDELDEIYKYKKPIIITFDDGYKDNFLNAYPILKKYGFNATIFIFTYALGNKNYLSEDDIVKMRDIISFQSHTLSHRDLTKLNDNELEKELKESKNYIENLIKSKVNAFAYPTGYYNKRVIDSVKKYYDYAVTNKGGGYDFSNNYEIKRIYISRYTSIDEYKQKIETCLNVTQ